MKVVIPGGTGQVGGVLRRALSARGDDVVVLSRHPNELEPGVRHVAWDGRTLGDWASEVDGADAVVNLAGRTVSCRYTDENLRQMMDSRVESTRVVGEAIAQAAVPPGVWLQMSTATIYADRRDAPNDEATGIIGGHEPGVPDYCEYSVRRQPVDGHGWSRAVTHAQYHRGGSTPARRINPSRPSSRHSTYSEKVCRVEWSPGPSRGPRRRRPRHRSGTCRGVRMASCATPSGAAPLPDVDAVGGPSTSHSMSRGSTPSMITPSP